VPPKFRKKYCSGNFRVKFQHFSSTYELKIPEFCQFWGKMSYADDTSIYFHTDASLCSSQLPIISACIDDINK